MFALPAEFFGTLKVSLGEETRRLKLHLPVGASAEDILAIMQGAVHKAFAPEGQKLSLACTYETGEWCVLSELTVRHLPLLTSGSTCRVHATLEEGSRSALQLCTVDQEQSHVKVAVAPAEVQQAGLGGEQWCDKHSSDEHASRRQPEALEAASAQVAHVQLGESLDVREELPSSDTPTSRATEQASDDKLQLQPAQQIHALLMQQASGGLFPFLKEWCCGTRSSTKANDVAAAAAALSRQAVGAATVEAALGQEEADPLLFPGNF